MEEESACPVEIATRAVEIVWGAFPGEDWKIGEEEGSVEGVDDTDLPAIGIAVEVSHSMMNSREQHIIVPSYLALANAGFHDDAGRLIKAWESAGEERQLLTLLALFGGGDS